MMVGIESIFSKIWDRLIDYGLDTLTDIRNFEITFETLKTKWKSLSAKASDVEEEIKNGELSGKKKRKREVENWLEEVKKIERELENEVQVEGFIRQFFGGNRAENLNARIGELVEQSQHFGGLLLDVYRTRGEELLTRRLVGKAFEENLERIWKFLVTDNVSSIAIYGMGGVGKTTLAKNIHNRLLKDTTYCVFWVTVSQEFNITRLQDEIAHVLLVDLSDEYNEDKRAARLNRALSQRNNVVLILDDVWESIDLEKIGDPLRLEGCRLIITTRSLEVCHQIGCREKVQVKTLEREEAWDLFRETLRQEMALAPDVQEIAKSMAKVCDGLPLGIITIAGSMRGETAIHVWRDALAELEDSIMGLVDMEVKVFKVLKYSFDRLRPNHQRCFLYCSLHPEDHNIEREELVRKMILEELVDKRKSRKSLFDQGHAILDKLVNVCLLESSDLDCVKMHDLVRAMALKITEGKTKVIAGHDSLKEIPNEEEWTKDLEKMSLMDNGITEIPTGMSPNCPKLSTLLLSGNPLRFIADSFFSQMRSLCNLDLSDTLIEQLPNSLSDLESLKALLLGGCRRLVHVPYLGRLKALIELDFSGTKIKEVPDGMEKLVNLKYLSMKRMDDLKMVPKGLLLKFPYLQLLYLPYLMQAPVEEIESLKQLEEFSGRVKGVCDFNQLIRSQESKRYSTSYTIKVCEGSDVTEACKFAPEGHVMDFTSVTFYGCNLMKEERKDVIQLPQNIHHLRIHKYVGLSNCLWDDFHNHIFPIENLEIYCCKEIECILKWTTNEQLMAEQSVILKTEIGAEVAPPRPTLACQFFSLRDLHISYCPKMKKLGLPALGLPNLEKIQVDGCDEIEEIIEVTDDDGRGEGEGRVVSLPKLQELILYCLPRLKSICKSTMICDSMIIISLPGCPSLRKLPLFFPQSTDLDGQPYYSPPPALISICVLGTDKEWWESLEWEHPTHKHLLQPFLGYLP